MKKIVLAVSGGVDSIVLLDFLAKLKQSKELKQEVIVAHFDHGIREDSNEDLNLVERLAHQYGFEFTSKRVNLGSNASEDMARQARYAFLRHVAQTNNAVIATAHHKNDIIETVAINLQRGTGWRGLAVLDSPDIWRPLLKFEKSQLLAYAQKHNLLWREDSTNQDEKYLRNKLRRQIESSLNHTKSQQIFELWQRQIELKSQIDKEVAEIIAQITDTYHEKPHYSRYFFAQIDQATAMEILRALVLNETHEVLTRRALLDIWLQLKTVAARKKIPLTKSYQLCLTKTEFSFEKLA